MAYAPTFFERFGYLGTCVLLAEVLDNTSLPDPETGLIPPTLRQRCNFQQLCFAHVLSSFAEDLYWADVAATPDLADAERVVLTETHLTYALAWDERLRWRTPTQIRRLMQAHVRDLAPLRPCTEPAPTADLLPAPVVPLTVAVTVEVSSDELHEALDAESADPPPNPRQRSRSRLSSGCTLQQGLLRALQRTLQQQLATVPDPHAALALQALLALVARVQRWQQQTRQRVVNAVWEWCAALHRLAWSLTLGVPEALLVTSA